MKWVSDREREEAKRKEVEEIIGIIESNDPDMDKIITITSGHPNIGFGGVETHTVEMTQKEKILLDRGILTRSDIENRRSGIKIQEYVKEHTGGYRNKKEQEIMQNLDPSMDEMGTLEYTATVPYYVPHNPRHSTEETRRIRITRREYMLLENGLLSADTLYNDQQARKDEENFNKRKQRIGEIMLDRNPELDEMVMFWHSKANGPTYYMYGTKRQEQLWYNRALPESDVLKLREAAEKKIKEQDSEKKETTEKMMQKEKTKISIRSIIDAIGSKFKGQEK